MSCEREEGLKQRAVRGQGEGEYSAKPVIFQPLLWIQLASIAWKSGEGVRIPEMREGTKGALEEKIGPCSLREGSRGTSFRAEVHSSPGAFFYLPPKPVRFSTSHNRRLDRCSLL